MLSQVIPKSEILARENLNWLFILRNFMLAAESVLIVITVYGLNINLPQEQLWLAILSISAVNLYTWMRLQTDDPVTELELFSQLCIDVLAITSLLYMTGGASNPITWVFLVPLIITAIILPQSYAWYMVIMTTTMYTLLVGYNIPLPSIEPHVIKSDLVSPVTMHQLHSLQDKHYFNLHIFGMWFGFVFSAGIVAFFVVELAKTLRERERRLAEARENNLRNERIVALGTLAASAAHDMGTPLGTMAILTHELLQENPEHRNPVLYERLQIMQQQITRCKEALSMMSLSGGKMRAESGQMMPVINYIDSIINQWRAHNPSTKLNLIINPNNLVNAKIVAEQTLTHAILNILNNAAEVSSVKLGIDFQAEWDQQVLTLKIRDHGPGIPENILDSIGQHPVNSDKQGLGVGLFLTCSTIKRLNGTINFEPVSPNGTSVNIELPLLITEDLPNE